MLKFIFRLISNSWAVYAIGLFYWFSRMLWSSLPLEFILLFLCKIFVFKRLSLDVGTTFILSFEFDELEDQDKWPKSSSS